MSGFRDAWVRAAAIAAGLLPVYYLCIAMGTKYGLFNWATGFALLTLTVGPILCALVLLVGIIGIALAGLVKPRRGWRLGLLSMFIPCAALLMVAEPMLASRRAPPLHDVSTDLIEPPRFSASVAAERALSSGSNSLDLDHARTPGDPVYGAAAGRLSIEVQQVAFPDIQPIPVGVPKSRALAAAQGAAQELGWTIDRVDTSGGTIEARAKSFWYGFIDDIVIRVTPVGAGAVIDVRSSSRAGPIDLGANAERIRAFTKQIAKELARG